MTTEEAPADASAARGKCDRDERGYWLLWGLRSPTDGHIDGDRNRFVRLAAAQHDILAHDELKHPTE